MKKFMLIIVLTAILMSSLSCSADPDAVTLPCGYVPNVQFAPLYVGLEKGFFTEENIDLTLDHSMETDIVALVGAGRLPFGICSGEQVLLGREQGLPLVYITNWYQNYPVGILALKESGISSMEDLKGKTVGIPMLSGASYIGLEAMLGLAGMKDSDIKLESVGYAQAELLVTGKIDAAVVYTINEPVQLKALGYDTVLFSAADMTKMVGNGMVTNEKMITENPELVNRMVHAFVKSIRWTAENPDEAFEICKKYVDGLADAEDPELQKQVLLATADYFDDGPLGYGFSDPEAWDNMAAVMKNMGMYSGSDISGCYTNEFIPQD
ncbi:MAG: ABC transporter substrate-binding protein [Anaerolineaceae bacterium]|nr:ABC transporter substrate-binding protein [Anaerolineaceae bacterium]